MNFAKIALISLIVVGGVSSVEAVDIIRGATNAANISVDSSVDIQRERRTNDANPHNDRYWINGANTVVADDYLAQLHNQITDSAGRDGSGAPSQINGMIHASDEVKILGTDIIFIQDQGSQWKVYGKAYDEVSYFFYKDVLVGTYEKTSSEEWQSFEKYIQIPRELYTTTVIDSWEDNHFYYEVVRSPKN